MIIQANGYKFILNDEGYVEAFKAEAEESVSSPRPVFVSNHKVVTNKDFEIEVSYIINDHLGDNENNN
jgi:hypothetical protein